MATKHATLATKVTPSPELKKEQAAIEDLLVKGEDEHWQIGSHYLKIVDGRLAQKSGYKSARDFFSQQLGAIAHLHADALRRHRQGVSRGGS